MAEKKKTAVKEHKSKIIKEEGTRSPLPELRPGMTVKIYQKIKELSSKGEEKERIQFFEGLIIAKKHGQEAGGTITVRKISDGVAVEKIFPLHLPTITKIEVIKQARVRRAKMYYMRQAKTKKLREKKVNK